MTREPDIPEGLSPRNPPAGGTGEWDRMAWPDGWVVRYVPETGSTNDDLLDELGSGRADHRSVLATGHQTAGRGRLDRRWEAPADANLLVSLAFTDIPDPPIRLVQRVGLSVVAALESFGIAGCGLKWPNDVLIGDAKVAGILAKRSSAGLVVGTGVNVGWSPAGATAAHEHGAASGATPPELLRRMLAAFDELDSGRIEQAYAERLGTLGHRVRARLPDGTDVVGRAVGVDREGRLEVLDACAVTRRLDVADVVHLRTDDAGSAGG